MKQNKKKKKNKRSKLGNSRRRLPILIFVVIFACLGTFLLLKSYAYRTVGISNGSIYAFCSFSHRSNDDPIVFPGRTGAAHSHDFFGATSLNAFSTNDSIRQGGTSCHRPEDKSAYWVPTLYFNDQPINPTSSNVHDPTSYRITAVYGGDHHLLKYMQPFPPGLRMIAGTSSGGPAVPPNRNEPLWGFLCRNSTYISKGDAKTAPTCSESTDPQNFPQYLQLRIQFPNCWDGVNLDSTDHKSHMAYAFQQGTGVPANRCPASHPVILPILILDIGYYGVKGGPATRLSSGDMSTIHADFMNGWEQTRLTELVNICLKRDVYCGGQKGPAANHNNEPEDVDDAAVQAYLNSPAGRAYIAQAEKTLPAGSSSPASSPATAGNKAATPATSSPATSSPATSSPQGSSAPTPASAGAGSVSGAYGSEKEGQETSAASSGSGGIKAAANKIGDMLNLPTGSNSQKYVIAGLLLGPILGYWWTHRSGTLRKVLAVIRRR